jgi:hypothetical protein
MGLPIVLSFVTVIPAGWFVSTEGKKFVGTRQQATTVVDMIETVQYVL